MSVKMLEITKLYVQAEDIYQVAEVFSRRQFDRNNESICGCGLAHLKSMRTRDKAELKAVYRYMVPTKEGKTFSRCVNCLQCF